MNIGRVGIWSMALEAQPLSVAPAALPLREWRELSALL